MLYDGWCFVYLAILTRAYFNGIECVLRMKYSRYSLREDHESASLATYKTDKNASFIGDFKWLCQFERLQSVGERSAQKMNWLRSNSGAAGTKIFRSDFCLYPFYPLD